MAVRDRADVFAAAVMVRSMVMAHGGGRRDAAAASTAAAELVQNIVVHGGGRGQLLAWFDKDVLVIRARDRGPGIGDPEALFAGSLARRAMGLPEGTGLGEGGSAVRRLMDRVRVRSRKHGGLEVTAHKCVATGRSRRPWS